MIVTLGIVAMVSIGAIMLILNILKLKGKRIKRRKKSMNNKKGLYKPKVMTQQDIDNSLKRALKGGREQQQGPKFNPPSMGQMYRPPTMGQRQAQSYPKPRKGQPQQSMFGRQPEPQRPQEVEQEPYWSAQDWEAWALQLYQNFDEAKQFLPEWFIQAVEE